MIKSMTGYGKSETVCGTKKISAEVRSLNSKQLDLSVRMPSLYRPFEFEIRSRIGKAVQRGKVDVYINVESSCATLPVNINKELFIAYYNTLKDICRETDSHGTGIEPALIESIMRLPEVVTSETASVSEEEQKALLQVVDDALAAFDSFRVQEGQTLRTDLLHRIELIEEFRKSVEPFEGRRVQIIKDRIRESVAALSIPVDSNRLEQEIIFYIERLDVTEEKVRLDNHCRYFREVAGTEENAGRKLGFIAQEMGREINTLGSKANDSEMQQIVVRMKDELEKIKEQVLNIL